MQYDRGETAAEALPRGDMQMLQDGKAEEAQQLRKKLSSVRALYLDHFRNAASGLVFFSLPAALFDKIPVEMLVAAAASGSCTQALKVSEIVPETLTHQAVQDLQVGVGTRNVVADGGHQEIQMILAPDTDDFVALHEPQLPEPAPFPCTEFLGHALDAPAAALEQQQASAPKKQLVVFKLVHAAPHKLKRPMFATDRLQSQHVALRLYRIVDGDLGAAALDVEWSHVADITCELFSHENLSPHNFAEHLQVWELDPHKLDIHHFLGLLTDM